MKEVGTRLEARKQYMKLSGAKRYSLMVMLNVENIHVGEAVEKCLDYIEQCKQK